MVGRSIRRHALLLLLTALACTTACSDLKSANPKQVFPDRAVAEVAEAAAAGDTARVDTLIQSGANPDAIGDKGISLLKWAMLNQNKRGFEGCSRPARIRPTPTNQAIPSCTMRQKPRMPGISTWRPAPIRIWCLSGDTSLHVAAEINQNRFVLDLLDAHADPAVLNQQHVTFQRYLYMTPENLLTGDARRQRERVTSWPGCCSSCALWYSP
jgi:hypothetical protein